MKKTVENLFAAFLGESQARNRYTLFSKIAKKEGYVLISKIFEETANQEREHGGWNYKMLQDLKTEENFGELEIKAGGPTTYGTTEENLKSAIAGEDYEWQEMYPGFADVAEKEGFFKETGLDIEVKEIVAVNEAVFRDKGHHALFITFKAKMRGGEFSIQDAEEILQIKWIIWRTSYW